MAGSQQSRFSPLSLSPRSSYSCLIFYFILFSTEMTIGAKRKERRRFFPFVLCFFLGVVRPTSGFLWRKWPPCASIDLKLNTFVDKRQRDWERERVQFTTRRLYIQPSRISNLVLIFEFSSFGHPQCGKNLKYSIWFFFREKLHL